jgi:hypothetical protein
MNIPGFTAEVSLLKGRNFGTIGTAVFQDAAEIVEPAMRPACVSLSQLLADSIVYDNPYMKVFITGAMMGAGCFG